TRSPEPLRGKRRAGVLSARGHFLRVTREATLRGDQFSAVVTGGIADRPAPGSLEVVDVVRVGVGRQYAEKDEVAQDRVRADKQVAGAALVSVILLLVGLHRGLRWLFAMV